VSDPRPASALHGERRRARLADARLYVVCDCEPGGRELSGFLAEAIAGGVDVVQLRDKDAEEERLLAAGKAAAAACSAHGALFLVNDRPDVALAVGADGVHVGQDDLPVHRVREVVGADMLVGLSTHAPSEVDAALAATADGAPYVDYVGVGPVHPTPTKPGRPAVGTELVAYASAHAHVPFFAIGGIDRGNIAAVLDAGASRVCVLRAICAAEDPQRAAQELQAALELGPRAYNDGRG
jgi:thiamine-phosphate pyrophosphorylase